jgi:hypothetical protein
MPHTHKHTHTHTHTHTLYIYILVLIYCSRWIVSIAGLCSPYLCRCQRLKYAVSEPLATQIRGFRAAGDSNTRFPNRRRLKYAVSELPATQIRGFRTAGDSNTLCTSRRRLKYETAYLSRRQLGNRVFESPAARKPRI